MVSVFAEVKISIFWPKTMGYNYYLVLVIVH